MSHDNPLIPPREILEIPNSQLPVLLVQCKPTTSRPVTLSSREEPCRLASHSHPGRSRVDSRHTLIRGGAVLTHVTLSSGEEPCRLASHSHPGRSRVDSRHTLIRGGAMSTRVTLSSGEEPCRLASHSHPRRSHVDSYHTLIRGGAVSTHVTLSSGEDPVGTAFICPCILVRNVHVHVVSFYLLLRFPLCIRTVIFELMQEQHSHLAGNHRVNMYIN